MRALEVPGSDVPHGEPLERDGGDAEKGRRIRRAGVGLAPGAHRPTGTRRAGARRNGAGVAARGPCRSARAAKWGTEVGTLVDLSSPRRFFCGSLALSPLADDCIFVRLFKRPLAAAAQQSPTRGSTGGTRDMAPERLADSATCAFDCALDRGVGTAAPRPIGSARPSEDARKDPSFRVGHLPFASGDDGYYTVRPSRSVFPLRLCVSSRHADHIAHRALASPDRSPIVNAGPVRARAPRAREIGARVRPFLPRRARGVRERPMGRARGPLGRARG